MWKWMLFMLSLLVCIDVVSISSVCVVFLLVVCVVFLIVVIIGVSEMSLFLLCVVSWLVVVDSVLGFDRFLVKSVVIFEVCVCVLYSIVSWVWLGLIVVNCLV